MATGEYSIRGIPAGEYSVTASKEGYISQTKTVTVIGGEITVANFQLEHKPVGEPRVNVTFISNPPANLYIDGVFKGT